jgi:peptide/nickel transport system substrate-binding protein
MDVERVLAQLNRHGMGISRRELLKYAGIGSVAFGVSGLLAACGDDDDDDDDEEPTTAEDSGEGGDATPTEGAEEAEETEEEGEGGEATATSSDGGAEGEPQQGGIWRMALHGDPSTNVVQAPGALVDILTFKVMYNNLVQYQLSDDQASISVVPDLAESWEANEDLTEYTFVIKEGVTWHDGEPFTVDDVVFTIETVLNPDNSAAGRTNLSSVESVEVVDESTVRFILNQSYADLPIMLGYNRPIFPKHLLEGADFANPTEFMANPVGTGPFKFQEQVQGSHLALEAFEEYFDGRPLLDGVYFAVIPDGNTRVAQLLAGDVDFTVIEPAQLEAVQNNEGVEVRFTPQVNYYFFAINHSIERLQDVRVRQALVHAVDRQAIVDNILQGAGSVAVGPINPLLGDFFNPTIEPYPYDLDQAAALLEEAGWTKNSDGKLANEAGETFPILFNGPSINPIMVQVIQYAEQQYSELGFEVTLDIVDWPVHLEKYRAGEYDLLMEWWITPPSPDQYSHYHTDSENWWKYSNPEVDDLLDRARSEPDYDARVELYQELSQALHDDVPVVFLYHPQEVQAIRRTHDLPFIGYRDALTWMEQVWVDPE